MGLLLKNAVFVGLGGFFGSILRYLLSQIVYLLTSHHWYPLGTLIVNVSGSFLMGFLAGLPAFKGESATHVELFVFAGLLGGFTTFSAFSHEVMILFRNSQAAAAFGHIGLHVFLCCAGAGLGYFLARHL